MAKLKENEFKCASCNEVFEKVWSDEEAMEESRILWEDNLPKAVICDDCFKRGMKKMKVRFN